MSICIYMYIYTCVSVCVYVCMIIYVCIHDDDGARGGKTLQDNIDMLEISECVCVCLYA